MFNTVYYDFLNKNKPTIKLMTPVVTVFIFKKLKIFIVNFFNIFHP